MANDYGSWAKRKAGGKVKSSKPAATSNIPSSLPPPPPGYTWQVTAAGATLVQTAPGRFQPQAYKPAPVLPEEDEPCKLVKPDGADPYKALLASLPDLSHEFPAPDSAALRQECTAASGILASACRAALKPDLASVDEARVLGLPTSPPQGSRR